jgi:hypothetical protein
MRKTIAGLLFLFGLASPALAQQVQQPVPNAGVYGAYLTSPPTCVNNTGCWLQTDVNGNLKVTLIGGGGGGLSVTDQATWTQGTSPFTPAGGVFNDTATLSSGQQGTFRLTTKRAQIVDIDSTGSQFHTDLTSPIVAGSNTIGNVKLVDTAGTNLATVKAASTAPVATDTSVVTALNPNSPGIIALGPAADTASVPEVLSPTSSSTSALSHASVTALGNSLVVKASAGNLYAFNCSAIAGAAAGNCIAVNASSVPATGALTGSTVLDSCNFDTTTKGCSLSRIPIGIQYGTGIVILVSSAASPFTYTTGTDTAFISADYK